MNTPTFRLQAFDEISLREWYRIAQLRLSVFVVEQDCPYQDFDGKDLFSHHFSVYLDDQLVAYARIVPPGVSYEGYASIGRVVSDALFRKQGFGRKVMAESIASCRQLYPDTDIKISAQSYLLEFYKSFGFKPVGQEYMEDGIPHHAMILSFAH